MASLTETQTRYLALAWLCFDAEPKIDFDRFAELAGLASAASGREMLRVTKQKLFKNAPAGMIPDTPTAAKTPRKKATPKSTKNKGKGGKKRKVPSDDEEEDNDEEETPLKRKKTVIKNEPVDEDHAGAEHEAEV